MSFEACSENAGNAYKESRKSGYNGCFQSRKTKKTISGVSPVLAVVAYELSGLPIS
jgi:hypothetical protein